MKGKPSIIFSNKLSTCLSKFREASTSQIGHQQFAQLLSNTQLKQILPSLLSKLDLSEHLNQRQRKQYAKVYITLIDHFGEQILFQTTYEKIMESLNKKIIGVPDVVGHLCNYVSMQNYISRIQPLQNTKNYILYIMSLFKSHPQIHLILKKVSQTISPIITSQLQSQIISLILQKLNTSKSKSQPIQCLMSLVLSLEQKFNSENLIQPLLVRSLKSQDWNVRKAAVDICYALMVVKEHIHTHLHQLIKQIKYDKIKHVRDSVLNYQALYKQVYGDQSTFKPYIYSQKTVRTQDRQLRPQETQARTHNRQIKSPLSRKVRDDKMKTQANIQEYLQAHQKNQHKLVGKIRNETFFKNAKDSNVIKISDNQSVIDNNRSQLDNSHEKQVEQPRVNHLRQNRSLIINPTSPSTKVNLNKPIPKQNTLNSQKPTKQESSNNQPIISPKFNLNFQVPNNKRHEKTHQKHEKTYQNGEKDNFYHQNQANHQQRRSASQQKRRTAYKYFNQDDKMPDQQSQLKRQLGLSSQVRITQQVRQKRFYDKLDDQNERKQYLPVGLIRQQSPQQKLSLPLNHSKNSPISLQKPSQSYLPSNSKQQTNTRTFGSSSIQRDSITQGNAQLQQFLRQMFQKFEDRILGKIDRLEERVQLLENSYSKISFGKDGIEHNDNDNRKILDLVNLEDSAIQLKGEIHQFHRSIHNNGNNKQKHNNHDQRHNQEQSSWMIYTQSESPMLESNLGQKVNQALRKQNIDQAFSLVLANNKKSLLLKLLSSLLIPKDKTVQQCLLLELKKHLSSKQCLKWLKNYLIEKQSQIKNNNSFNYQKIFMKIKQELAEVKNRDKDYVLLKNIVVNQIDQKFSR